MFTSGRHRTAAYTACQRKIGAVASDDVSKQGLGGAG